MLWFPIDSYHTHRRIVHSGHGKSWVFHIEGSPYIFVRLKLVPHIQIEHRCPEIPWVRIEGAPDLIEQPFGELNTVFMREFNDNWRLTLKGKNLMDERSEVTQGGFVTTGFNRGREVSLKVDYRF